MMGLLLIAALTISGDAQPAGFRPTSAVSSATISVRILEAGRVHLGPQSTAERSLFHPATVFIDGQKAHARLIEFE